MEPLEQPDAGAEEPDDPQADLAKVLQLLDLTLKGLDAVKDYQVALESGIAFKDETLTLIRKHREQADRAVRDLRLLYEGLKRRLQPVAPPLEVTAATPSPAAPAPAPVGAQAIEDAGGEP